MRIIKRYELANFVIKVPFWVQKGKKNVLWSKSQCKKVQTYSSSPQHLFLPVAAGDGLLKEIGCLVHSKLSNYPFLPSFPLATVGLWDAHEQTEWVSGCKLLSHVQLFATPRTTQSMEFSKPEHWSGQLFHSPGDLPNPGIKLGSPALQVDSLSVEPPGKPNRLYPNTKQKGKKNYLEIVSTGPFIANSMNLVIFLLKEGNQW